MIDPNTSATGALMAVGMFLLGMFRWLTGRQIKRIDNLEKWQLDATREQSAMQADLTTVKKQVNDIHNHLMSK